MEADFSGYATKAGLKCTDGRTIMPDAFKHQDQVTVPLVWQHGHNDPKNVLGHAVLENREDGVYCKGYFNDTEWGAGAKALVVHDDVKYLSIWANGLVERSQQVFHGFIREVSLVLAGANPGAKIDYVAVQHSDGMTVEADDEAIITTGLELSHADASSSKDDGPTVEDLYNTLNDQQKELVHFMVGAALGRQKDGAEHSATGTTEGGETGNKSAGETGSGTEAGDGSTQNTNNEGTEMTHNVFDKNNPGTGGPAGTDKAEAHVLTHDAMKGIVQDAVKRGSLKDAVTDYALEHGINDLEEVLFPDAKTVGGAEPQWIKRETAWVADVLAATNKSPFSRIKTRWADITHEEARAKGYIKGNMKKEEFFGLGQRITTPTTIYKKQKLDRDDIVDVTDFDIVRWMKGEMRLMFLEEVARAALIGDGRPVEVNGEPNPDKVKDPMGSLEGAGIRSILNDSEFFVTEVNVNVDDADSDWEEVVEAILRARRFYKGTGQPVFYTTEESLTNMLLSKDGFGRRRYRTAEELATAMRVSRIVPVEVLESVGDLVGIIVNLQDYTFGADRGGEMTFFEDFDIDFNQHKYLYEGRSSGALTKFKSAQVVRKVAATDVVVKPQEPAFNKSTNTISIPTQNGVDYQIDGVTQAAGPVVITEDTTVDAVPQNGFFFSNNVEDEFTYTFNSNA